MRRPVNLHLLSTEMWHESSFFMAILRSALSWIPWVRGSVNCRAPAMQIQPNRAEWLTLQRNASCDLSRLAELLPIGRQPHEPPHQPAITL